MAFQIFKRASGDADKKTKPTGAPISGTGPASVPRAEAFEVDYNVQALSSGIDVEEEGQELAGSLQTAALLFAGKQIKPAAAALKDGLATEDGKNERVWLSYLDLLRRANDRATFDEAALKFVVQFERSAPSWDELSTEAPAGAPAVAAQAAFITFPNSLLGEKPAAVSSMLTQAKRPRAPDSKISIDVRDLAETEAQAALAFAQGLVSVRRQGWVIEWRGLREVTDRTWKPLRAGDAKFKERWLLGLELLNWAGREKDFEDRAVDFAVTFELSPPSYEKLTEEQKKSLSAPVGGKSGTPIELVALDAKTEIGALIQKLEWKGEMAGPSDPQLTRLFSPTQESAQRVEIDMQLLRHVDFVCAGAISNGIVRTMAAGRSVRIYSASPILRALLQLTGVPEKLFLAKKRK